MVSEDDKSEDSCSVFSETQFEKDNLFAKVVTNKTKQRGDNQSDASIDDVIHSNHFEVAESVSPKIPKPLQMTSEIRATKKLK